MTDAATFYRELRARAAEIEQQARALNSSSAARAPSPTQLHRQRAATVLDVSGGLLGGTGFFIAYAAHDVLAVTTAAIAFGLLFSVYLVVHVAFSFRPAFASLVDAFVRGIVMMLFIGAAVSSSTDAVLMFTLAAMAEFGQTALHSITAYSFDHNDTLRARIVRRAERMVRSIDTALGCLETDKTLESFEEREAFRRAVDSLQDELDFC